MREIFDIKSMVTTWHEMPMLVAKQNCCYSAKVHERLFAFKTLFAGTPKINNLLRMSEFFFISLSSVILELLMLQKKTNLHTNTNTHTHPYTHTQCFKGTYK